MQLTLSTSEAATVLRALASYAAHPDRHTGSDDPVNSRAVLGQITFSKNVEYLLKGVK